MEDQEVVIVGSDGTEHHFPAGMDPQVAISIVRKSEGSTTPPVKPPVERGGLLNPLTSVINPELEQARGYLNAHTETPQGQPIKARSRTGTLYDSHMGTGAVDAAKNAARGAGGVLLTQAEDITSPVGAVLAGMSAIPGSAYRKLARGAASVMEDAPSLRRAIPFAEPIMRGLKKVGQEPLQFHEQPLATQMDRLPETPAPERVSKPPLISDAERSRLQSVQQTPDKPNLENVLTSILQDSMAEKKAPISSTTLQAESSVGGTQKPRIGKRPGGYMTDLPPVTETRYKELQQKFGGTGPIEPNAEDVIGHAPDDVMITPDKPKLSAPEVAAALRREYGSRDAGRMLYGSGGNALSPAERADAVKRLAPGPSQLPLAAEQRINDAIQKARGEGTDDPLLKAIIAGLSGNMLSHQPTDSEGM